ncbi:craniofacial development protein 2-like [Temnothorax nylanderi]|uniref:craniofacial development protein 2-like n=1 Tax=Temnothorax nylanderi TaxID=102681 RepID=UPI003A8BD151
MAVPSDSASDRRCTDSGSGSVKWATGHVEVKGRASHAKWTTGPNNKLQLRNNLSIGTWNVRGLLHTGKLNLLERELMREKVDICGISETHWKDQGHFHTEHHNIYMSGGANRGRNGVAFLVSRRIAQTVHSYEPINDRIIKITLAARPRNLHLIQVYMPTGDAPDEEIESIYGEVEDLLRNIPSKEPVVIIGDFNAKVGKVEEAHLRVTGGAFGLGVRNERGERFIQFAVENDLAIMNTMFQHHPRRLSTWISPNKEYRNQIDYMIIKKR